MGKRIKRIVAVGVLAAACGGAYFAYEEWGRKEPWPVGLIQANGRIEGDRVSVASKFGGRIVELMAREGDEVRADEAVVRLEGAQVETKVAQASRGVVALEAQRKAAVAAIELLRKQVPLKVEEAQAGVARARDAQAKALAAKAQAERDYGRYSKLAAEGSFTKHKLEQAELAVTVAGKDLDAAGNLVLGAEKKLAQANLGWEQIEVKQREVEALTARIYQARAVQDEPESVLSALTIKTPIDGIVTTRIRDVGEVVGAGTPLLDIVDLDRLYLKVYVPEVEIGKLRRGLEARIYTDAFPEKAFPAKVRYISSRAEFTPKEVQTPDERVKLVYAVHLYLDRNPGHALTPGMPADAVIRWKEDVPWTPPQW